MQSIGQAVIDRPYVSPPLRQQAQQAQAIRPARREQEGRAADPVAHVHIGTMTDKGFRHRRIGVGPAGQHQGAVTQHGRTAVHIKPLAQQKADHLRVPVMLGRQQKRIVPQSGVAPRQNLSGVGPGLHQGFQNGRIRAECRSPQKGGKAIGHGGIRLASGL